MPRSSHRGMRAAPGSGRRRYAEPVRASGGIDLHTHSRVSDGTEPPAEVVAQAVAAGSSAFAGILHPRQGYIEPHYAPTPQAGVRLIRAAGGVPVLAHPGAAGRDRVLGEAVVAGLVDEGLFGLELYHRENTPDGRERVAELAERFSLAVTGSSDYHGTGKPNRLGENTN